MGNSFERPYQREFGSVGTEEDGNWGNRSCYLEKVFSQFLGFLHFVGIYRYELGEVEKSFNPVDDLENLFVSVRDSAGNFFWHCPALCQWGLTMDVDEKRADRYDPLGEVNKAAYGFLGDNYNGDSLLGELLLLFEHLDWVRSGCLRKRIRILKDVRIVRILEEYSLFKRNGVNVDEKKLKNRLYKAQRERCTGCGLRLPEQCFELDHIWPKSKGGELFLGNAQLLCKSCNGSKQDTSWVRFIYYRGEDLRSAAKKFEQSETEPLF